MGLSHNHPAIAVTASNYVTVPPLKTKTMCKRGESETERGNVCVCERGGGGENCVCESVCVCVCVRERERENVCKDDPLSLVCVRETETA